MSSSSYLGHGAKYWAEHYFELQTQTRMPDHSSALEWRDKYLNLEKSCSLYQSQIADLRTEVADLREKNPPKPEPELFEGHTVEYWFNEYLKADRLIKQKERAYQSVLKQNQNLLCQANNRPSETYEGHDAEYWFSTAQKVYSSYEQVLDELKQKSADYDEILNQLHDSTRALSNTLHDGHDASYWYENAIEYQKNFQREKHRKDKVILLSVFLFIGMFFFGLFLGEGYFVPSFIPSSPYIDSLNDSIASEYNSGYNDGKNEGFRDGYSSGYNFGKEHGYKQGYSAGVASRSSSDNETERVTRSQIEQWSKELDEKQASKENESSSRTTWTAEKVKRIRESIPN